ncbi:MAG: hypothetical protein KDG56_20240, partial [Ottowia sp.]|nr:hypothetical protein [Ottowia sp.]
MNGISPREGARSGCRVVGMLAPRSGGKDSEADKRRCDGGWAQVRELLASFLDFFSAFFSFG